MRLPSIITIDGPAASGKSTLGQLLAQHLGYLYFDTGVMYRALTALALEHGVDLNNEDSLTSLAETEKIEILPPRVKDGRQYTVMVDRRDVTWQLRSPAVEQYVSHVSRYPRVRTVLREAQRRIGLNGDIVMVGRDIGAVVMPEAGLKIFLEASLDERARRRQRDLLARQRHASYEEVLADLRRRDELDRQNTYLAEDAHILSSDKATAAELVEHILSWFEDDP